MITCIMRDGKPTDIRDIGGPPNMSNPSYGECVSYALENGRRLYRPATAPNILASHWEDDGTYAVEYVDSVKSQAQLDAEAAAHSAEEAASEAAYKATPIVYDRAIEVPLLSILSQTGGKGIGITATDEGDLVPIIVHESPWPDKATLDGKIAAGIAKHKAAKGTAKAGISGQLQERLENLERLLGLRP